MNNIFILIGPTASGKSNLAMKLISKFPFEIINADLYSAYKGLNIGTAKPLKEELNKFFNKAKVKSFKNIKIKLKNEKILKGKSRLNMKEFADTDLIMWWNIDLSGEKPVGEIEIEISGKGPQIKLTTIN